MATAAPTEADLPKLRDGFTAAVRDVATSVLLGPEGLEAVRGALNEATRRVLLDDEAYVLITDYVVL